MQTSFFGYSADLTNVDPGSSFEPVPAGWYTAVLSKIETRVSENSLAAKCEFKIMEGPLSNRMVFENNFLIMHRTSAEAHQIAQRKLRQWCDAVGISPSELSSADPFLGKTVRIKVSVQPGREYNGKSYGPSNRVEQIAAYTGMPETSPTAVAPAPRAPVQQAQVQHPAAQTVAPAPTATPPAHVVAVSAAASNGAAPRKMPWQK